MHPRCTLRSSCTKYALASIANVALRAALPVPTCAIRSGKCELHPHSSDRRSGADGAGESGDEIGASCAGSWQCPALRAVADGCAAARLIAVLTRDVARRSGALCAVCAWQRVATGECCWPIR